MRRQMGAECFQVVGNELVILVLVTTCTSLKELPPQNSSFEEKDLNKDMKRSGLTIACDLHNKS